MTNYFEYQELDSKIRISMNRINEIEKTMQDLHIERRELLEQVESLNNIRHYQMYGSQNVTSSNLDDYFNTKQDYVNNDNYFDNDYYQKYQQQPYFNPINNNHCNNISFQFQSDHELQEIEQEHSTLFNKIPEKSSSIDQFEINPLRKMFNDENNIENIFKEEKITVPLKRVENYQISDGKPNNNSNSNNNNNNNHTNNNINNEEDNNNINNEEENINNNNNHIPYYNTHHQTYENNQDNFYEQDKRCMILKKEEEEEEDEEMQECQNVQQKTEINYLNSKLINKTRDEDNGDKQDKQLLQSSEKESQAYIPTVERVSNENQKPNNQILQTPVKDSDTSQEQDKTPSIKQKAVPKVQKIRKTKKQPSTSKKQSCNNDTEKLQKFRKTKLKKVSQFEDNSQQKENSDSNNKKRNALNDNQFQNQHSIGVIIQQNVQPNGVTNNNQQQDHTFQENNQEFLKQLFISLPNDPILNKQQQQQIQYLLEMNEKRTQQTGSEADCLKSSCQIQIKNECMIVENDRQIIDQSFSLSHQQFVNNPTNKMHLDVQEDDNEELKNQKQYIKEHYNNFLIEFNNKKAQYSLKEKEFYRYSSHLKMKIVEFSKYMKLIQIQKDTQISQETIRKWQKRYTDVPEKIMQFDINGMKKEIKNKSNEH